MLLWKLKFSASIVMEVDAVDVVAAAAAAVAVEVEVLTVRLPVFVGWCIIIYVYQQ
jgi:hypothetical protein